MGYEKYLGVPGNGSRRNFKRTPATTAESKSEYVVNFDRLDGGLNIYELDYRLDANESPNMKNLHWKDGALGCRSGQTYAIDSSPVASAVGYASYSELFWDNMFFHIGTKLYRAKPGSSMTYTQIATDVPEHRGVFFRYGEDLYYKTRGGFYKIRYVSADNFTVTSVATGAYTPITYINMNPATHAGTAYQPENRINSAKTLWYSTVSRVTEYHLPVTGTSETLSIVTVTVDGVVWPAGSSGNTYSFSPTTGIVTFNTEPTHHNPTEVNTVHITYSFTDSNYTNAYNSVMDCDKAIVYGGDQNLCVVVGGCPAQPNAYFWNGNHIVMDASYWPMEQYNLAGDTEEEITGFGKQQSNLIIFKSKSVGKAEYSLTTVSADDDNARLYIQMPYTAINSKVGCDLPNTIQLIENNLVFCNTKLGVHILHNTTPADENNIEQISRKVNGDGATKGLLKDVRAADAFAVDYHENYWLIANGNAYLWDYELSTYSNPSWFFYDNINPVSFTQDGDDLYHLNAAGKLTKFTETFSDYGGAIEKVYQFATQYMGGYDRYKDVRSVMLAIRSDTVSKTDVVYLSDYETRYDQTPIESGTWTLKFRNLKRRYLGVMKFARVERRTPMCRHVRHFSMRLENNRTGDDLSVVSAQIFYTYQGRQK